MTDSEVCSAQDKNFPLLNGPYTSKLKLILLIKQQVCNVAGMADILAIHIDRNLDIC